MRFLSIFFFLLLAACSGQSNQSSAGIKGGKPISMAHAKTFSVVERDGYRIVDMQANLVSWGGGASGSEQKVRLLLVPKGLAVPKLEGDLSGAVLIRTPVERIAVNYGSMEAILTALGIDDRLVAVGGLKSYNDSIRERVKAGKIAQIGYGWHAPPNLDALLASKPELLIMSLSDLTHVQAMERTRSLGIAVMPAFIDNEPHYLGSVDYVRLLGMLTGKEKEAEAYVAMVHANVKDIKTQVAKLPRKQIIYSWYSGGDKWMATVQGGDGMLLTDAGADNPLAISSDPRKDNFQTISSETMLAKARNADCWVWRDSHSKAYPQQSFLSQFKAVQQGCVFAADGMTKPEADAFDYYERAPIRPDLELHDLAMMLHPSLRNQPFICARIQANERDPGDEWCIGALRCCVGDCCHFAWLWPGAAIAA
jgi:iron complex transport system substrate-binding protein